MMYARYVQSASTANPATTIPATRETQTPKTLRGRNDLSITTLSTEAPSALIHRRRRTNIDMRRDTRHRSPRIRPDPGDGLSGS